MCACHSDLISYTKTEKKKKKVSPLFTTLMFLGQVQVCCEVDGLHILLLSSQRALSSLRGSLRRSPFLFISVHLFGLSSLILSWLHPIIDGTQHHGEANLRLRSDVNTRHQIHFTSASMQTSEQGSAI